MEDQMSSNRHRTRNPFTTTIGETPLALASRVSHLHGFDSALGDRPGSHKRNSIGNGTRGDIDAKMGRPINTHLRKQGYPMEKWNEDVVLVMEQMECFAPRWLEAA